MLISWLQTKILRTDRRFKLVLLLLMCSFTSLLSAPESLDNLIESVLMESRKFSDIEPVIDIIKNKPSIFEYFPSISPIKPTDQPEVTSRFGYRKDPVTGGKKFHKGVDLRAGLAVTIHATAAGEVIYSGIKGDYGRCVVIRHSYGFSTLYAHLSGCYCKEGQKVRKGQIIAFLGNTGKSTGEHLHYEVIKNKISNNPLDYFLYGERK